MASPWLEKKQRMCSSGPCERRFNLRQTAKFNKSARGIIHSSCLLPRWFRRRIVVSLLPLSNVLAYAALRGGDCRAHGEEDFIGGDRRSLHPKIPFLRPV
jgi:hypothetical protein